MRIKESKFRRKLHLRSRIPSGSICGIDFLFLFFVLVILSFVGLWLLLSLPPPSSASLDEGVNEEPLAGGDSFCFEVANPVQSMTNESTSLVASKKGRTTVLFPPPPHDNTSTADATSQLMNCQHVEDHALPVIWFLQPFPFLTVPNQSKEDENKTGEEQIGTPTTKPKAEPMLFISFDQDLLQYYCPNWKGFPPQNMSAFEVLSEGHQGGLRRHSRLPHSINDESSVSERSALQHVKAVGFPPIRFRDRSDWTVQQEEKAMAHYGQEQGNNTSTSVVDPEKTGKDEEQKENSEKSTSPCTPEKRQHGGGGLGHCAVDWDRIYRPRESFTMSAWATLPEKNTLQRGTIFVSIASYRDRECSATLRNIFTKARSPFRIYAGISEERAPEGYGPHDISCLSSLNLQDAEQGRQLLWGKDAPSWIQYTMRQNMVWKDVLEGRSIQSISYTEPSVKNWNENISKRSSNEDNSSSRSSASADGADVPTTVYMDPSFVKDSISCVAGSVETAHDLFLLALHSRGGKDNPYTSAIDALSPEMRTNLQQLYPLRVSPSGQNQQSSLLAGCRLVTRVSAPFNAKGPTYARFAASLLYFNQDYFLLIDSHSRFSLHWDSKMIQRVFQLRTRGVISHYPNGYVPANEEAEFEKEETMGMCKLVLMYNGVPQLGAGWMPARPHPTISLATAGGLLFGDAQFMLDTPYDPFLHHLFHGEEILYSARVWTRGWDIYSPGESNVFHYYARQGVPRSIETTNSRMRERVETLSNRRVLFLLERYFPWEEDKRKYASPGVKPEDVPYIPSSERRIVKEKEAYTSPLIGMEVERYGMGRHRTLDAYWEHAQLTDHYMRTKDNENRWEGGQEFCEKQKTM